MNSEVTNSKLAERRTGRHVKRSTPLVSIIIPAFNVSKFVVETLTSVKAQTFTDYETIVINDGSDDTVELEKMLRPFFNVIVYIRQENGGVAAARNQGIEAARGKFLAFLDADDLWLPEYLQEQLSFIEAEGLAMAYCDAVLFGENTRKHETFMEKAPSNGEVTSEALLLSSCNIITSGTICLKDAIISHGLFDENAHRVEDFDMWFRLARNRVRISYQKRILLKHRIRIMGSLTGNSVERAERSVKAFERVKSKYELSKSELDAWHGQIRKFKAEVELEKGKDFLRKENIAAARQSFQLANQYHRMLKLTLVDLLLSVHPKLVVKLFTRMRPNDH